MEKTLLLKFELFTNAERTKWGWKLVNYQPEENQRLANSIRYYPTKEDCITAIQRIKESIPFAGIDEQGL